MFMDICQEGLTVQLGNRKSAQQWGMKMIQLSALYIEVARILIKGTKAIITFELPY